VSETFSARDRAVEIVLIGVQGVGDRGNPIGVIDQLQIAADTI